jgi:Flp pilus assembly protein TadD
MRGLVFRLIVAFSLALSAAGSSELAQTKPVGQAARDAAAPLLDQLKTANDEATARMLEARVWSAWFHSGDDDIDGLMVRASELMQAASFDEALAVLDTIVAKAPGFAEGWNKRATLLYAMSDYDRSLADIGRVLALEPRHFGALSGIGLIRVARGDKAGAVAAYRRVLDVDPMNIGAKASIDALGK